MSEGAEMYVRRDLRALCAHENVPIARQVLTLDTGGRSEKTIMRFFPLFAYQNTRRREKSIVGGRGDLAWPKLRTVSSVSGRGQETRVSPTARRKGNGVTCESSGTRNVFAKTGGSLRRWS